MTIVVANDSVTYKSPLGDTARPADVVVAVNADGTPIGVAPTTSPTAVQGNLASGAADSGNPVKIAGVASATAPATAADGQRKDLWVAPQGQVVTSDGAFTGADGVSNSLAAPYTTTNTNPRLAAEANFIFNSTTWDRLVKPNAASRIASAAASVNATSAKGSAGNVFKVYGNNVKASIVYLKIYNKATAPTVGTDTPVLTIPLAASSRFDIDLGSSSGFYLGTGIAYGFTTDAADNGTTALLAADILGFTLTYA